MTTSREPWPPKLILGATGHRVLPDESRVTTAVDLVLNRIELTYGSSPLTVLSPLASGADQLIASRVLTRPGSSLIATLPMPLEEYLADFPAGDERHAFLHLLDQASGTVSLPPAGNRAECYEAVGHYTVEHSDLIIAVWDGKPARGPGGTAQVVALARRRSLPLAWIRPANRPELDGPGLATEPEKDLASYERFPAAP